MVLIFEGRAKINTILNSVGETEFRMVLIFEGRAKMVEKWEDVFSINFLIHLTELKRRLSNTDISLTIDFVYW